MFQDNSNTNLKAWEDIESAHQKIGREKVILWNRKESSAFCCVRSVCDAFGPDSKEDCGRPLEFGATLQGRKNFLQPYRGNRFNIPFENATAVFHHKDTIMQYIGSLERAHKNQLLVAIEADLGDPIVLGGIRAMALLERHVTSPLYSMIDSAGISIINSSNYYTHLQIKLQEWIRDPEELVTGSACLFEDFAPIKDDLYESMYSFDGMAADRSDPVSVLTQYGLTVLLIVCLMILQRQAADHLPGGKYHPAQLLDKEQALQSITKTTPKHNKAAEQMFAGLDRLKRSMPNSLTVTMEGILLWAQNKPVSTLPSAGMPAVMNWARQQAPQARKDCGTQAENVRQHVVEKERLRMEEKKKKEDKKAQAKENVIADVYSAGGPCKSRADVDKLLSSLNTVAKKKTALKSQLRYQQTIHMTADKKLFAFSAHGKQFDVEQLVDNLLRVASVETVAVEQAAQVAGCDVAAVNENRSEFIHKLKAKK